MGDFRDAARSASEKTGGVLSLVSGWNALCDLLAVAGIGRSPYWLRHDAAVREAETGETGLFGREVWALLGVDVAVWILLKTFWPT